MEYWFSCLYGPHFRRKSDQCYFTRKRCGWFSSRLMWVKWFWAYQRLSRRLLIGIILLLQHYKIETHGKHVVVIGRSNIVGTPISILLSRNTSYGNSTVTLCHSRTKNLEICLQADIIIAAIGKPKFVNGRYGKRKCSGNRCWHQPRKR